MSDTSADARMRRLLALVPWVAERDGPTIDEIGDRFGVSRAQLLADLDVVFMVGRFPYTPDELIEVVVEEERVWIRYADWFARPLRLTPAEGLALVTAGASLLAVPGAEADGPLARGLTKLADALGVDLDETVDVHLGDAPTPTLELLARAVEEGRRVAIEYYSYGRDVTTARTVDPWRVHAEAGQWYLTGHCHRARAERHFRVDRIGGAELTDERFDQPAPPVDHPPFRPGDDTPRVVLDLGPGARWVLDQYPVEAVSEPDARTGRVRVTLAATATAWFERLVLALGVDATLVSVPDAVGGPDVTRRAAARVLARYRPG